MRVDPVCIRMDLNLLFRHCVKNTNVETKMEGGDDGGAPNEDE